MGDAVFSRVGEFTPASHAQYCAVPAVQVTRIRKNITMRQAAALSVCALTAWQGLTKTAGLKQGDKVFIAAGSGGVGSFAVQVAKIMGAKEIWCTGSKVDLITGLGATKAINYKDENVVDALAGQEF